MKPNYSPKKEKALKIYTLDSKPSNSAPPTRSTHQNSATNSQNSPHIYWNQRVPDLD